LLLVRRVRLLLLLPPLRACPAPLPGAPGQGSKEGCRQSQPQGARLCCSQSCDMYTAPVSTASGV
jgi:hypothetical protein